MIFFCGEFSYHRHLFTKKFKLNRQHRKLIIFDLIIFNFFQDSRKLSVLLDANRLY